MGINRFEDLDCWKKARELTIIIYRLTGQGTFIKDFGLKEQIRRASVSIMSNIAEGFGNISTKEFIRFLGYSIRSSCEVQSQLYVAIDQQYISHDDFNNAYLKAEDCRKLCKGFVKYLNSLKLNIKGQEK